MSFAKVCKFFAVAALLILVTFVLPLTAGAGVLEDALDNPVATDGVTPLTFNTEGAAPWTTDAVIATSGGVAARSGAVGDAMTSSLITTVTGPATIAFYQKVSSQLSYDGLSFYIDNMITPRYRTTGEVDWQKKVFTLLAGTHTLRWKYTKNATLSKESDAAWVDKLTVSPYTLLAVTAPNGKEKLIAGENTTITWNAPAAAEKYDLYYSTNSGSTWKLITSDFTSPLFKNITYSSWAWPVPITNMLACKVKVVAKSRAGLVVGTDVSNLAFSVNNVLVTSPNGGNRLQAGETFDIVWSATASATKFALSYSWDNGSTWHPIANVSGVNTYQWSVPVPTVDKIACKVKVVASNDAGVVLGTDISDAAFTTQVVKVTSPNGGESLNAKATPIFPITFSVYGVQNAAYAVISYSTDNGATWPAIVTIKGALLPGSHSYYWTVPTVTILKSACKVKVVLKTAAGAVLGTDVSDLNFAIQPLFSISGAITKNGVSLSGVYLTLTGAGTGYEGTNSYGKYTFPKVIDGNYTITPSLSGYTFTPSSLNKTVAGASIIGVNFTATPVVVPPPVVNTDTTPPLVPTGLVVTVADPQSTIANLSWNEVPENPAVRYRVYRNGSYLKNAYWDLVATDTGLAVEGSYCYRVSSYDSAGNESAQCAPVCVDRIPPTVPVILTANPVYPSQVDLTWTTSTDLGSGLKGYNLYRDGVKVKTFLTETAGSNGGLKQAINYCFTVSAFDKALNESAQSEPVCPTTPPWQFEYVAKSINTDTPQTMDNGVYNAVTMDSAGHLHAVYENDNNSFNTTFQYTTNASGTWSAPTTLVEYITWEGVQPSIATDSNDKVHVSFYAPYTSTLYYLTNTLGSWVKTTIDSGAAGTSTGACNSLVVDKNDKVHVSYCDANGAVLKYATNASGSWVTTPIDTDTYWHGITGSSITLDSTGNVHISYTCGTLNNSDSVKYATNASGSWGTTIVDENADSDLTSIGIDSTGKAHIAYREWYYGSLHYATNASGPWATSTIDTPATNVKAGFNPALKVDKNDKVHVVYQEQDNYNAVQYRTVKHATNASGEWNKAYVVEPAASLNLGSFNTLIVDQNNKLHITTYDEVNHGLKHGWY